MEVYVFIFYILESSIFLFLPEYIKDDFLAAYRLKEQN